MDLFQIERLAIFFFFLRMGWQCINRMEVETLVHNHNNASGNIEKDINYHQLIIIKEII